MYNLLLFASILAVVLSPLLLDVFLTLQEAQTARRHARPAKEKTPEFAWAMPRLR